MIATIIITGITYSSTTTSGNSLLTCTNGSLFTVILLTPGKTNMISHSSIKDRDYVFRSATRCSSNINTGITYSSTTTSGNSLLTCTNGSLFTVILLTQGKTNMISRCYSKDWDYAFRIATN